jgi:hypothetical protein
MRAEEVLAAVWSLDYNGDKSIPMVREKQYEW